MASGGGGDEKPSLSPDHHHPRLMQKDYRTLEERLYDGMNLEQLQEQLHWARINGAFEAYDIISKEIREIRNADKEKERLSKHPEAFKQPDVDKHGSSVE